MEKKAPTLDLRIPISESIILLDSVKENCAVVENLAMDIVSSQHVPLLNSMYCMAKSDFKLILEKCKESQNITDKYLLLIVLTDFISCVCANNNFPVCERKNEVKYLKLSLLHLETIWDEFFYRVAFEEMKIGARESLVSVIQRCLDRNRHSVYENILQRIFMKSKKKEMKKSTIREDLKLPKEKERAINKSENPPVTLMSYSSTKNKIHCNSAKDLSLENKCANIKNLKKNGYDITRFILKPCENVKFESGVKPHNDTSLKRKCEISEESQPSNLSESLNEPPRKKKCLNDDYVNGKVNAFKHLMMSQKKSKENKTV